ncbi:MAG: hypothetical protein ACI9XO_001267 [Paraglaciecola sp.]|jgi:hypothetical protein
MLILIDEIKDLLKMLPREKFRVKKTVNRYVGVSLNVFMTDADSLRPIVNALKDKELFVDRLPSASLGFSLGIIIKAAAKRP